MFGFAIVGCGMIARFHARAIREIPEASVTALISRSAANAQAVIAESGIPPCPIFPTLEAALQTRLRDRFLDLYIHSLAIIRVDPLQYGFPVWKALQRIKAPDPVTFV